MQEQGIGLVSARAGNVIGGGDWPEDRLIPDILRAFEKKRACDYSQSKINTPLAACVGAEAL